MVDHKRSRMVDHILRFTVICHFANELWQRPVHLLQPMGQTDNLLFSHVCDLQSCLCWADIEPRATLSLQEVLTDSLAMEWTPEQSALLRQLEGVETVVEAVKRVQRTSQV